MFKRFASGLAITALLTATGVLSAETQDAPAPNGQSLRATYDDRGLASLDFAGFSLMQPAEERAGITALRYPKDGAKPHVTRNPKPMSVSFDASNHRLSHTYDEAKLDITWTQPTPKRLDIEIELTNTGDRTWCADVSLATLRLTRSHAAFNQAQGSGTRVFTFPGGAAALMEDRNPPSVQVGLPGLNRAKVQDVGGQRVAVGQLSVSSQFPVETHHTVVDNAWFAQPGSQLEPGASARWEITLLFDMSEAALQPALQEWSRALGDAEPIELQWPDRRPIGMVFWTTANAKWPTNPRGFNFGKGPKNDVLSEEGLKEFHEALLTSVDRSIQSCLEMDAQGLIFWDIGGAEMWHPITWIADPRVLKDAAPEIEAKADEIFRRVRDAGLTPGLTIRPTDVFRREDGQWYQREVADPAQLMSDKIQYAKDRWGVKIFYLDSNIFNQDWGKLPDKHGVPYMMPWRMLAEVQRKHPDVLIIPEWSRLDEYRFGAPYSSPTLRQLTTPDEVRQRWPEAFRVVAVYPELMAENWNRYLQGVSGGDVLLYRCWYNSEETKFVAAVYREAELLKQVPDKVRQAEGDALLRLADDDDEATRYYAVRRLGEADDAKSEATLVKASHDPSVFVARIALEGIAARGVTTPELRTYLAELIRENVKDERAILRAFAADALGAGGVAAIPELTALLQSDDKRAKNYAVQSLGRVGVADEAVIELMLSELGEGYDRSNSLQEQIVDALGQMKAGRAVPVLLKLLEDEDRNSEFLRLAAVRALGDIGDTAAVGPLVEHTGRRYSSVVVYRMPQSLNESLTQLTGQHGIVGKNEWHQWHANQNSSDPAP